MINEPCFVLDQHTELDFKCASSLAVCRKTCHFTQTHYSDSGLGIEPTTFCNQGEHTNHEAVTYAMKKNVISHMISQPSNGDSTKSLFHLSTNHYKQSFFKTQCKFFKSYYVRCVSINAKNITLSNYIMHMRHNVGKPNIMKDK